MKVKDKEIGKYKELFVDGSGVVWALPRDLTAYQSSKIWGKVKEVIKEKEAKP